MTGALAVGAGVALMTAGLAAVGYAVYLEMIHAVPLRWWDRAVLMGPAGLLSLMSGARLIL